jgi:serine/threonine-protein kinase
MAKNPIERYASAGDLAEAARDALSRPERDRAATILRRSETSAKPHDTLPNAAVQGSTAPHTRFNPVTSTGPDTQPDSPPLPQEATVAGSDQPGAPRKRNRWPIVAAAALVVVGAIAGIGSWLIMKPSGQQHSKTGAGKTAPASTEAPSNDQDRLLSLLPSGYLAGVCTPATAESGSVWVNAVAMVSCGQNTKPGGPTHATYGLFPTPASLKKAFTDDVANTSLVKCRGESRSPANWHYDQGPNETAGMLACGTYNNHPNVIWTYDEKLMLSDVAGDPATIEDLHTWWDNYS